MVVPVTWLMELYIEWKPAHADWSEIDQTMIPQNVKLKNEKGKLFLPNGNEVVANK